MKSGTKKSDLTENSIGCIVRAAPVLAPVEADSFPQQPVTLGKLSWPDIQLMQFLGFDWWSKGTQVYNTNTSSLTTASLLLLSCGLRTTEQLLPKCTLRYTRS